MLFLNKSQEGISYPKKGILNNPAKKSGKFEMRLRSPKRLQLIFALQQTVILNYRDSMKYLKSNLHLQNQLIYNMFYF